MNAVVQRFYGHGKLLLSGEYFVLAGAQALVLPLRLGQHVEVLSGTQAGVLRWESMDERGELWMQANFALPNFELLSERGNPFAERLQKILRAILDLRGGCWLSPNDALLVRTQLEFSRYWGLGTSSTLLACLAEWAVVNPYLLAEVTFGGSGYDLAAAKAEGPFFFRRVGQEVETWRVAFDPPFRAHLYFLYLGRKQDSREAIRRFEERRAACDSRLVAEIDELSKAFSICREAEVFQQLMREHEKLVAGFLDLKPLQQTHFADFSGAVKSLGAWGGDFALVCSTMPAGEVAAYFNQKGLRVLFSYDELVACH